MFPLLTLERGITRKKKKSKEAILLYGEEKREKVHFAVVVWF